MEKSIIARIVGARHEYVKPIRNGLRKEQNVMKSRPSWAETGLAEGRMELNFTKKSRRDRISFESLIKKF